MRVEVYIERLRFQGVKAEMISQLSDRELLKYRGVGKKGMGLLREKFGPAKQPEALQLSEKIANALYPVLLKFPRVGKNTVNALARMVAAYFD